MEISNPNKRYHRGPHAVYSCQYHVIWCPKYRRSVLVDGVDDRLKEIILKKQADYGYTVIEMEVMPDHVHLLVDVDPTRYGINNVVSKIKGYSSVGAVSLDVVKRYIEEQKGV